MQHKLTILTMAAFGLLALGLSCGGEQDPTTGGGAATAGGLNLQIATTDSEGVKVAKTTWLSVCVSCHGSSGEGDGPAGRSLDPKPRSFGDAEWQASVDDAHIRTIIARGGAAVGKSPLMTGAPHLEDNDEALAFLVKIVRSFGG